MMLMPGCELQISTMERTMVDPRQIDRDVLAVAMGMKVPDDKPDLLADMIPHYARIQVPLKGKMSCDDCADILLSLAHSVRALSRRTDLSQGEAMRIIHWEVKAANSKMLRTTKYGIQK